MMRRYSGARYDDVLVCFPRWKTVRDETSAARVEENKTQIYEEEINTTLG
jgi:hypothetical protein